ncbi:hypothetical protein C8J57DRAFT_533066 [Mycena rebaudengoi]|nr:hypothetical protein C8J57DRAFT_533066 [Mycena rebaudengoi]
MPTSPVLVSPPPRLHPSSLLAPPIFHRRLAISPFVDLPLLIGAPEEMIVHVSEVASDPFLAAITTPPKPTVPMRSTPHPLANSTIPLMSTRVINRRHSLACKPLRSSPLAGPVIFSSCDSDEEVPVVSSEENRGARPSRMSSFPDLPLPCTAAPLLLPSAARPPLQRLSRSPPPSAPRRLLQWSMYLRPCLHPRYPAHPAQKPQIQVAASPDAPPSSNW